jgi:excisionase family DNA binding protein
MPRTSALALATRVEPDVETRAALEDFAGSTVVVRHADGREEQLPALLTELLRTMAEQLSAGHAVTILAADSALTPAEVGRLLGLSRPFVARLLDEGTLPSTHLPGSSHRVVRLQDVLAFAERRRRRGEGRRRIIDAIEDADLPY